MDDHHQFAWMLVSYPKVFVTLATTDPPCKALQEQFVTRHANQHGTGQEPPEAIVSCKNSRLDLLCFNPCSASRDLSWVCIWCFLKKANTNSNNTNYSAELCKSVQRTIFIIQSTAKIMISLVHSPFKNL